MTETRMKYAKLIGELCRRNTAVAFAASYGEKNLHVHWKRDGDPMVALGLAARLYHELPAGLTTEEALPNQPPADISQEIQDAYPEIKDYTDLSFVTTSAIFAELYRIPGYWVLGLQKKNRDGNFVQFILWYGPAVNCSGLAAILQHQISKAVSGAVDADKETPVPLNTMEARTRFFLADLIDEPTYDPLQIGGICAHMTYEANRFRQRGRGSMNTAQDYVESDGPDQSVEGQT